MTPCLDEVEQLRPDINRKYVPGHKQGGSVSFFTICEKAPAILALYQSPELRTFLNGLTDAELKLRLEDDPHAYGQYCNTKPRSLIEREEGHTSQFITKKERVMQVCKHSRNIAVWTVALSLIAASALCGGGTALAEDKTSTGNRVFFRGGYGEMLSDRAGELITDVHTKGNTGTGGYYIGGGTELMITKDLWGVIPGVALVGEIGLEFKRWASSSVVNGEALVGNTAPAKVQMTMLTASVAPKVKFRQGTDFQPWIIPAGLDFHVISPTSSQVNYLDIGVQFGGGAEFRLWKELWLGLDSRFHLASNQTNTVNNFWTAGIYGAIGF